MISVVRVTPLVGVTYQKQHKRYLYGHPLEVSVEVPVLLRNLINLCHLKLA